MRLEKIAFDQLPGWRAEQAQRAWPAFFRSAQALVSTVAPLRKGVAASASLREICAAALRAGEQMQDAAGFFTAWFAPRRIVADGFLTGYYEPEVAGALAPGPDYTAPALARPNDLVDMREDTPANWDSTLEGARRLPGGALEPYPTRGEIMDGAIAQATRPVVWLADAVELFLIQVQGSARVILPDGARRRLVYDGRNGRPYTSIGRILIESGAIPATEMSLARLKQWLREMGLGSDGQGAAVMRRNLSYVFFRLEEAPADADGPIGGQGVPLSSGVSLAVDRSLWSYGLPFWIAADLPALAMRPDAGRLWIAQDTGSAIVGPGRADLFIGSGPQAGAIAGNIRHQAECFVLHPRAD